MHCWLLTTDVKSIFVCAFADLLYGSFNAISEDVAKVLSSGHFFSRGNDSLVVALPLLKIKGD
jgi:hypothetical protein